MLGEFPDQLVVAEWHTSGGLNIPYVSTRASWYNVSGVPHVRIDGKYAAVGAGSCSGAAATYRNYINARLAETGGVAPVAIEGVHSTSQTSVSAEVTITLDDPVTLLNPTAFIFLTEDDVLHLGQVYNHIVRAEHHQSISLTNPGDQVVINVDFPMLAAYDIENLNVLACVQKMTGDKEMYNAANIPLVADFEFAWDPNIASVPQGTGTAEFEGTLTNISDGADNLTIDLDNTFGWIAEFMVEGEAGFHTTPSVINLATQEQVQVYMRVHTDDEVRVGEGGILIHSQVSDRTQLSTGRVFNGSPAILLVDDDNGLQATEVPFENALLAAGYLFDTWDVKNEHADQSPNFDEMKGYDLVLWIAGWQATSPIITADDATNLMAMMDLGKGLIVSSQDFLNGFTAGDPFIENYLGIATWDANVGAEEANGVATDPITDGMALDISYPSWQLDRADQVNASAVGTEIFTNETGLPIGVRAETRGARSVTYAFAATAVAAGADPNNLNTLIARSVEWVLEAMGQGAEEIVPAFTSQIGSVAPNPLQIGARGGTAIRLRLGDRASLAPVQLDILDLNGRLVRNVVDGSLPSGVSAVSWDGLNAAGRPVGAGVYYARLTTLDGSHSARVVVLR